MNQLKQDPAYIAMRAEKDAQWEEAKANHQRETMPLLTALRQHGLDVRSLDELRQSRVKYRSAIPILIHWLRKVQSPDVKESIVRTLSVPWAKPEAADPLIVEFLTAPDSSSGLKWAIGNALEVVADESVVNQLCDIVRDRRHDTARQMIVLRLGKSKDPRVVDVLIELLDDDQVSGHALTALARLKAQKARPHIERFLQDPRSWVRKEAAKALAKLDN